MRTKGKTMPVILPSQVQDTFHFNQTNQKKEQLANLTRSQLPINLKWPLSRRSGTKWDFLHCIHSIVYCIKCSCKLLFKPSISNFVQCHEGTSSTGCQTNHTNQSAMIITKSALEMIGDIFVTLTSPGRCCLLTDRRDTLLDKKSLDQCFLK